MLTGQHSITRDMKARVLAVADESFTRQVSLAIEELSAAPEGWVLDMDSAIAVKLRGYCDPHTDEFQGRGAPDVLHRSLFWLISDTSRRRSKLIAEGQHVCLEPGQWAVFDDSQMHAFLADGTWVGVAIQMAQATAQVKPPQHG